MEAVKEEIKLKVCSSCGRDESQIKFQQYYKICNGCKSKNFQKKNPEYIRNYMKKYMKERYVPVAEPKKRGRKIKNIDEKLN